ncbi:hypothetical protein ASPZODRAFT_131132 [Penicilliopsis zonata CBS 506.65]|uniref:Secreted protein n=1 Tax=Penicilliopsis zonata CBS 506.65 TaxID=1073090 RepID=A0A1L9SKH6_9EURO|nr:hypothetical protein ASPZODRAFT_131132 [Penicilliopsis zonata CBS 506.65]OJJ47596.1 hypothetical protein ASPZODRAFT_131132 [Penicilliopsis zonata CBS 506.65]
MSVSRSPWPRFPIRIPSVAAHSLLLLLDALPPCVASASSLPRSAQSGERASCLCWPDSLPVRRFPSPPPPRPACVVACRSYFYFLTTD